VQDLETARELQDKIGTYGVLATSEGKNQGTSGAGILRGSSSAGRNENVHEIKRPLIMAQELMNDARTDELFVISRAAQPLRVGRAIFFRRPEMAARVDQDRFHRSTTP
jgi:type IV secretion system protein VirD4